MAKSEEKETKKPKKKTVKKIVEKKVKEKKEEKVIVKEEKPEKKEEKVVVVKEEVPEKKVKRKKIYKSKEAIIIMILSMIIGFGVGYYISYFMYHKDSNSSKDLKELNDTYDEIVDEYYGSIDKNNIFNSSMYGLLSGLNDRYATFNSDMNSIMNHEEEIEGKFNGFGVTISSNEAGQIYVVSVFDDSPAQKSGIKENDILLSVDDKEYNVNNFDEFPYNVKNSKLGTSKKIKVLRDNETIEVELKTEVIDVESVILYYRDLNDKKIAVFVINNFANNTYDQFVKKYEEAKKNRIDAIVLDLRNNSEGTMENASKIASLFLNKDAVIYQKVKAGENEKVINKEDKVIDLPVVTVINYGSISTAEMLASTLNENLFTPIIGEKSFGKGYLQKMVPLTNGRSVTFSVEEWETAKGVIVENVGILPTVEVQIDEEKGIDTQIEKALEVVVSHVK